MCVFDENKLITHFSSQMETPAKLNPKVDTPLFATNGNPLQPYHFPRAKILAFSDVEILDRTLHKHFLYFSL